MVEFHHFFSVHTIIHNSNDLIRGQIVLLLKNIDRLTCYKSILNFIACIFHAHWSSKCQVEWLNTIFRDGSKNAKVFAIFDFQMNFSGGLMAGFSFTFDPISRQEFDLSLQPIPRRCHHFVGAGDKCFILSSTRV